MKNNSILALSLLTVSMLLVLPVSAAKNVGFRATGKVLNYTGWDPENPGSSMVVGGHWSISVSNYDPDAKTGDVKFELYYREKNLISADEGNAPEGSVDQFWMNLVTLEFVDYVPGEYCYIYGHFNVDKFAWRAEGSTPPRDWIYNFFGDVEGSVLINPSGLDLQVWPWYLTGSTCSMTMR